jgi:hypothetical protein
MHNLDKQKTAQGLKTLAATLTDDTTDNKRTLKRQTKCQRFAKLKELQPNAQVDTIYSTFYFAQPHPSPPTTQQVDIWNFRQKRTKQRH